MEKVTKTGVKKERGWLHILNKQGDVERVGMKNGPHFGKRQVLAKAGVKREAGYLYFIDKQGDVSRAKMQHGRKTA